MRHFDILAKLALFPKHLVQRGDSLVIPVRISFSEVILRPLHEHNRGSKLVSNRKICDELCVIAYDLDVDLRPDGFNPVKDRLFAFLVLLQVDHFVTVHLMCDHGLFNNRKHICIRQLNRFAVDRLAPGVKGRLCNSCTILFFLGVRGVICHTKSPTAQKRARPIEPRSDTFVILTFTTKKPNKSNNFSVFAIFFGQKSVKSHSCRVFRVWTAQSDRYLPPR